MSEPRGTGKFAVLVALGVLMSRISGLIRQRFLAHYLGLSDAADAFGAASRIPNFLQNLFGEGVLSASFIPVYARLLAEKKTEDANRLANAIASLLSLVTSALVLIGVVAPSWVFAVLVPGFTGEKREFTIHLVRIFFPAAGLLVMSAWCLGVLNSHRRFLLSYAAPVIWNAAIIVTLIVFGGRLGELPLAEATAWGAVAGSALQFSIQLPSVLRLLGGARWLLDTACQNVRTVVRNFVPVFIGRGVVQISAYIDQIIASPLPTGAVAALFSAQMISNLPVSLFGMSISAAELPAMSSAVGDEAHVAEALKKRLNLGLRRIAFFVIPSAVALLALGDILAGAILQTGHFTPEDSLYVWGILAGASIGLLATTLGRLYSSTYYALRDTRTPLRFALVRVALNTTLGYFFALHLPGLIGVDAKWGAAGLTVSGGIAGWVELSLLRRALNRRIGWTGLELGYAIRLWVAAAIGAGLAFGIKRLLGPAVHPVVLAIAALLPYGLIYFAGASIFGIEEGKSAIERLLKAALRRLPGRR